MNTVTVSLKERSYSIVIGSGFLHKLCAMVDDISPITKCMFVLDANIETTHALVAMQSCSVECSSCTVEALESNKNIESIQRIWSAMLEFGCDRTVPLIAVGGGIVGDIGGFAAATYMRGVPLIQVPTTLLAMVDASIGGKTGINLPIERSANQVVLGKNLAGSFWQPKLVVADVDVLQTLDDRQLRCGLAECVKHAMLGHNDLMDWIEKKVDDIFARDKDTLIELVTTCATIKAEVVAEDERESGCRVQLNLGHTFAHAIEPLPELSLQHGEAVAIGLCAAVACAEVEGLIDAEYVDRIRGMLNKLGLPTRLPLPVPVEELLSLMGSDKKTLDASIRLVLPTQQGVSIMDGIDDGAIGLAWTTVGATM